MTFINVQFHLIVPHCSRPIFFFFFGGGGGINWTKCGNGDNKGYS